MIEKPFLNENNFTELQELNNNLTRYTSFVRFLNNLESETTDSEKRYFQESSSIYENQFRTFSKLEEKILERRTLNQRHKYDYMIDSLTSELVQLLKCFTLESDEITLAEKKIIDIANTYNFRVLGDVVQKIYIQYNDFPHMLVGICVCLERYDYEEVMPWGPTMLMGLLNHKSNLVKEYAIGLVENWATVELLPSLKNIECKTPWMQAYIDDVVRFLEERNVLHKKIV